MSFGDVKIVSNSKFLKIEPGQPHDIRVLNESPIEQYKHTGDDKPVLCKGPTCALCEEEDPIQKFITNIYDHGMKKVLLWEYGGGVAKKLKAVANTLAEESKSINDVDLKVEATGSGMQKRYEVTPRMTSKEVPTGLKLHSVDGELMF